MGRVGPVVTAAEGEVFDVELEEDILQANRRLAEANARLFRKYGVRAIDVMGAVGSGKTALIEALVDRIKNRVRVAALDGDVTTTIDADRIGRHGVPVVQINTGKECHLDANLVKKAVRRLDLGELDIIFIENVGNLICPAEFPLGSEKRVVVVSVTEGPYMVLKHPVIFMGADVVVINKIDLAAAMGVDADKLKANVKTINPRAHVILTSCRTGSGIGDVAAALQLD